MVDVRDLKITPLQARAILDAKEKVVNALAMFRPTEQQEEFFRTFSGDMVLEILLGGGNRCLAGFQQIYDPVLKCSRRIDEIDSEFHVNSVNPATGRIEVKTASKPFVKSYGELWRVTTSDGAVLHVTPEHRVVAHDGTWVSIRQAWEQQTPLASVAACRSSSSTYTSSGRNTGRSVVRRSHERSWSRPSSRAFRRRGISHQALVSDPSGEAISNRACETSPRLSISKFHTYRQFPERYVVPIISPKPHQEEVEDSASPLLSCGPGLLGIPARRSRNREYTRRSRRFLSLKDAGQYASCAGRSHLEIQNDARDEDAHCCSRKATSYLKYCRSCSHFCGAQPRSLRDIDRGASPSRVGVGKHNLAWWPQDGQGAIPSHIRDHLSQDLASTWRASRGLASSRFSSVVQDLSSSGSRRQDSLRSAGSSHATSFQHLSSDRRNHQAQVVFESSHPFFCRIDRKHATATINTVVVLDTGYIWDIEVESFNNYVLDKSGQCPINGNSGKSTCAAVAVASLLLNQPVFMRDGTPIYMRPERWRNEPLKVWLVGFDWKHVSKTIFRLLFKGGLFRVIRDQKTGKWRTWSPDKPEDAGLYAITRESPPLIKMSDILGGVDGMSWENKKERQVSSFELAHDGTPVELFASTGAKPQGDPAHLIWIDEKIEDEGWHSELMIRLADYRGRLLWTSWPSTAPSASMAGMADRAEKQLNAIDRRSFAFCFKGSENPYTRSTHRDRILETMDEDTRAARDDGVMNVDRWRVYARFSRFVHRVLSNDPGTDDPLAAAVRKVNGIPPDWTRYLILDPGTAHPAVLFVAVPPPSLGDFIVPYDELYIPYTPAKQLAEAIAAKTKGQFFEDFIIDSHAARQTPMGFDGTIGSNYEKEFAAQKLRCRRHGSRFSFGSDNVTGRILRLQGLLNIRGNGTPTVRILDCPHLVKQLEQYKWQSDPRDNPLDVPAKYQQIDLACCLEYLVSRDDCSYVKPPVTKEVDGRSLKEVIKHIRTLFGKDTKNKPEDQSVYCGAGVRPLGM